MLEIANLTLFHYSWLENVKQNFTTVTFKTSKIALGSNNRGLRFRTKELVVSQ